AQDAEQKCHVDGAESHRREDILADGGGEIELLRQRALVAIAVYVLEVHVPDAPGIAARESDRIAAAVVHVPGVEAESDERRIGAPQELFRLGRRFDVCPGGWMEGGHEAHLFRAARDLVRTLGEALPLVIGEMRIARAYETGYSLAFRNTGLREHEHRRTEIGEKPAGIHRIGHLLVVAKRVVQRHRTERAGEREAACTQLLPKYGGILREV